MILSVFSGRADFFLLNEVVRELELVGMKTKSLGLGQASLRGYLKEEYGRGAGSVRFDYVEEHPLIDVDERNIHTAFQSAFASVAAILKVQRWDAVLILGDRFEAAAASEAAFLHGTPIVHIHGGEKTTGSMDDFFRHKISLSAALHFVSHERYCERLIQLGRPRERIHVVGPLAIDLMQRNLLPDMDSLEEEWIEDADMDLCLLTVHPETMRNLPSREQVSALMSILEAEHELHVVVTSPGRDLQSSVIDGVIAGRSSSRLTRVRSLGASKYHALLLRSQFVIGNSSSGVIDAPLLGVPSINIGSRQDGRVRAESVNDVSWNVRDLRNAVQELRGTHRASSTLKEMRLSRLRSFESPSRRIAAKLQEVDLERLGPSDFVDL